MKIKYLKKTLGKVKIRVKCQKVRSNSFFFRYSVFKSKTSNKNFSLTILFIKTMVSKRKKTLLLFNSFVDTALWNGVDQALPYNLKNVIYFTFQSPPFALSAKKIMHFKNVGYLLRTS